MPRIGVALGVLWLIASGCGSDGGRHHPEGFIGGAMHGPALKMQQEDCRECHGEDLTGVEPSMITGEPGVVGCDGCHGDPAEPKAWRSNCTFCHGGVENSTGAPPRNLDGTDQVGPFPVHPIHVTGSDLAVAYDCVQCHVKAVDVLSPGHVFDSTPGEAENDFGAGLAPRTVFSGLPDRTCSDSYCHGDGRGDNGVVAAMDGPRACDGCHAVQASGAGRWSAMSGLHGLHLASVGVTCGDCHDQTSSDGATINDRTVHIDGRRQVTFGASVVGVSYNAPMQACTGACHGVDHNAYGWNGTGGNPHPPGFADRAAHGTEMVLQRQDCRGCHGADLAGGSAQSCDNCHQAGWRTTCTYCHGGGLNQTGAPPRDLGSTNLSASQSFVAHTTHVTEGVAAASDCVQCHRKPTDVMSLDHAFDLSPGLAEVTLVAGMSPMGTYNPATSTCGNLYCHSNGRGTLGTVVDATTTTCTSCHPTNGLSGDHDEHRSDGMNCSTCHSQVASSSSTITAPQLHVDGVKQMTMPSGEAIVWTLATRRCTGACHGENHNETW
jgi:predicted CxxxxCH...CXXCH cytochrome family protein